MIETIYTTDQVSQMLQIHPLTVLKYLKTKKLKGMKFGRVYRIKESDLNDFLKQASTQ